MKKFFISLLFLVICPIFVFSQTPSPTPKDDDVVKISTNLIQIDVTVTDRKGNIVKDLKAEDFEIYENGELQEITNFSFISNQRTPNQNQANQSAIPVPQAVLRPEQIRRTIALVVDDLSLSFESAYRVRRALKKFVDEQMQEGDLVAIIRTGAGIGALQQFTSDKKILYAAIEKVKWNPLGRGGISAFAPLQSSPIENAEESDAEETSPNIGQTEENFRNQTFITGTLGALQYIVNGMKDLPGRKSVILLSDGFEISARGEGNSQDTTQILDFLRRLIDAANRASVVFYTVDARGLLTTNITAADETENTSAENLQNAVISRNQLVFDTQEGLVFLARQTGGFPALNNNSIENAVGKVLDDQSYYLIGYQPDADTFDAAKRRFNKLEVRVKRQGLSVRYRSGFFNVNEERLAESSPNVKKTPAQQITEALISPFAKNEISIRLNTLFGNDEKNGSFVRSLLHISAKDLKFITQPDGSQKATFDILAANFGDNGQVFDQIAKTYTMTAKNDAVEQIRRDGFIYYFTFPIKKAGAYQLRIAIRDANTEKLGSASQFIEIPDLKKERLNLSGIVLENLTLQQWQARQTNTIEIGSNPMSDTSLRAFKRGTILRYGYEIYNAKLDNARQTNLTAQIRVFQDGKLILEGKKTPIDLRGQTDLKRIKAVGAINLGSEMTAGDYILQIIVTDNLAKQSRKISSQFVQFELIE